MKIKKILSLTYIRIFKFFPPFFNKALAKVFKKLHDLSLECSYGKDFLAEMNVENSKFKLWLMKNDIQAQSVYQALHKRKIAYETVMIRTLISVEKKLKIKNFSDIGSFMGYYACFVLKHFNERIKVYAIESNEKYSNYINKSLKANNFKNVEVINEILSDTEEDLFVHNEAVYKFQSIDKKLSSKRSKTLDKVFISKEIKPELIKIDVHGAEGKVLSGAKKILKDYTKVILLELHTNKYLHKFSDGLNRKKIIELLYSLNFKCYLVSSFRDFEESRDLQEEYDLKKKFDYLEVNLINFNEIFFDRNQEDQFIFACKKNIEINEFDCF